MKTTTPLLGLVCTVATLVSWEPDARAFCMEVSVVNCVDQGHSEVTEFIKPLFRDRIYQRIWTGNFRQDFDNARDQNEIHFDSCRFATDGGVRGGTNYIRAKYSNAIAELNPSDADVFEAAYDFGQLLHPVQDFYAHSNWINLLNLTHPSLVDPYQHLIDRSTGEWRELAPLTSLAENIADDIIVGQLPETGLPRGWDVTQPLTSEVPIFTVYEGADRDPAPDPNVPYRTYRGLVTGYNPSGACPDVRVGEPITDEWSHVFGPNSQYPVPTIIPRTRRLVHGESIIAGGFNHDPGRPCHDGYPTYVCLQKDHKGRPDYQQAARLAEYQSAHEWCRLLHLAKDSEYGYEASSILMTLFAEPNDEPDGPHPVSTPCGTPVEVLAGKPGPIEVTVGAPEIHLDDPTAAISRRHLVFALYTGDLRRSLYSTEFISNSDNVGATEPETICVNPNDTLVATVWGWDDSTLVGSPDPAAINRLDPEDHVLRGVSRVLDGPGFEPGEHEVSSEDMTVTFTVGVEGSDTDGDGLSACGETFYGTDPDDPDSDDDSINDGAEVNLYGTDPLDPDTDDDGLNDYAEINVLGTDPLDPDTDDDGLDDYEEVNVHGTNPLDPDTDDDRLGDGEEVLTYGTDPLDLDTDDDGLNDGDEVLTYSTDPLDPDTDDDKLDDGLEVESGTDPLDSDSDDDGILDGEDVEFIQSAIATLPEAVLRSNPGPGSRVAMLARLDEIELLIAEEDRQAALRELVDLGRRLDGCGAVPDRNDWILDCTAQLWVQELLDLLRDNLSGP